MRTDTSFKPSFQSEMEGFKKVEITFLPTSIFNSSSFSVYGGQGQVLQRTGFVSICSLILCPMSMSLNEILISSVFFLFLVCIAISYLVFFFIINLFFVFFPRRKSVLYCQLKLVRFEPSQMHGASYWSTTPFAYYQFV